MKKHFIYMTTNLITNEKYIDKHYGTEDDSYLGSGKILQRAILKYGKENFKREILYISQNVEENNQKEKEFIKAYNAIEDKNFYNIAEGGDGGDIFHTLPLEQQDQLRERARLQCTGEGNPMYGKHHSEETKQKMSDAKKGKKLGAENGNAKGISAYKNSEMTDLVKHFDTIQEALIWIGTKPTDYSGISKRMKENKPYKKYYWKKEV